MTTLTRSLANPPRRTTFAGVRQILTFNWPQYVRGGLALLLALGTAAWLPEVWALGLIAAAALAAYWMFASLAASHWVYDRSEILDLAWLRRYANGTFPRWLNIHAGFDQISGRLMQVLSRNGLTIDLYRAEEMTEPSISRARAASVTIGPSAAGTPDHLPADSGSVDLAVLLFAAHEMRLPARRAALFAEVRRTLASGGRIVVAEHLRNAAGFAAFGPGVFHFFSRQTWLAAFAAGGLRVVEEYSVTPFARVFILEDMP